MAVLSYFFFCSTLQDLKQHSTVLGLCPSVSFCSKRLSSSLPFCCIGFTLSILPLLVEATLQASVILKDSFKVSVNSKVTSSYPFLWQVHVHRDLYIWITSENHCKRFLHRWLYLFTRSMELVRFQCHHDGVSPLLTLLMFWVWLCACDYNPGCVHMKVFVSVSLWAQLYEELMGNHVRLCGLMLMILAWEGFLFRQWQ